MVRFCHINKYRKSGFIVALALIFVLLLFDRTYSQVEITKSAPDQDSLIQMVGLKNIDTTYSFQWNKDSSRWELYRRNLHFYNDKQLLLTLLHQNLVEERWINYDRIFKSYDEKGKVIETLQQEWNRQLRDWENLQLKLMTYNKRGLKTEVLYQQWRKALGKWFSTVRYLIEYNHDGERSNVLVKRYIAETEEWIDHQKYTFSYDYDFSPPSEVIIKKWNQRTGRWDNRGRYILIYDFRGNKKLEIQSTWSESSGEWINGLKYQYDYFKDLLKEQIEHRWDFRVKEWFKSVKREYKYNDQKEIEQELIYKWNEESQQWRLIQRFLYAQQEKEAPPSLDSDR